MTSPHAPGDEASGTRSAPRARDPEEVLLGGGYRESAYPLPRPPTRRRLGLALLAALFATGSALSVAALCRPPSVEARVTAAERALRPRLASIALPALADVAADAPGPCPRITITRETIGLDNVATLRAWPAADRARFLAALPAPWGEAAPLAYPALAHTAEVAAAWSAAGPLRLVPLRDRLTDLLMFHPFASGAPARPCANRALVLHADGSVPFAAVYAALATASQAGYSSFLLAVRVDGRDAALELPLPRTIALPPGRAPEPRETLLALARDGVELTANVAPATAACAAPALLHARFERTAAGYDVDALRSHLARLRRCDAAAVAPSMPPPRPDESPAERAARLADRAVAIALRSGATTRLAAPGDVSWSDVIAAFAAVRGRAPDDADTRGEAIVLELVRPHGDHPQG